MRLITTEERQRREAARDAKNPARVAARAQRAQQLGASRAKPAVRAAALLPTFEPFEPGRLAGWLVDPVTDCWVWTGQFKRVPFVKHEGKDQSVARVLYERERGDVPFGLWVYRTCPTRGCVNPYHHAVVPHGTHGRKAGG